MDKAGDQNSAIVEGRAESFLALSITSTPPNITISTAMAARINNRLFVPTPVDFISGEGFEAGMWNSGTYEPTGNSMRKVGWL